MEYATLTKQNQITVPMKVRDKLKLKPSDRLVFYESGETIKVSKLKSIDDFRGLLKNSNVKLSKQKIESTWTERHIINEKKNN
ncbi:MAG TPA: AbrB/MazE/SpoVT family DNA-binding domain-containing protein [bacterium]|jgi:AbrB family looped-hinge helix DNA binding protein|nr:AbrB/MazE/SpoVT family DNA-binding domain-containing protein [bacterium]